MQSLANQLKTALLFDVQRFSIHDGPGIRTTLFFKGCGLRCAWCHNPDSQIHTKELVHRVDRCSECRTCEVACPKKAINITTHTINHDLCDLCGICAEVCPELSMQILGLEYTPQSLVDICMQDFSYYENSKGGITLSGGEAILQHDFLEDFLPMIKNNSIHVTLETAGFYPWKFLEKLLPYIDLIYYDLKIADPEEHKNYTSKKNEVILENLKNLTQTNNEFLIRMPVIPEINNTKENVLATVKLLNNLGVNDIFLLKYNNLWESKLFYLSGNRKPLNLKYNAQQFDATVQAFEEYGLRVSFEH